MSSKLVGARNPWPTEAPARFHTIAQCSVAGVQDMRVHAVTKAASDRPWGYVSVRVGRLIVLVEDIDALECFTVAWSEAGRYCEEAFGKPLPRAREYRRLRA